MDSQERNALHSALEPVAASAGVSNKLLSSVTADLQLDETVLKLADSQPEHLYTVGQYIERLVTDERIATAKAMWNMHRGTLDRITDAYGVPPQVLLAIWGIESNFGTRMGKFSLLRSLATLIAKGGRRQSFWCEQFIAAIELGELQNIPVRTLTGSWAGAIGHMQFIPTTYRDFAIDFDNDGRADIVSSISDAFASAANYLAKSGWQHQRLCSFEIVLPYDFDFNNFADGKQRPFHVWQGLNMTPIESHLPTCGNETLYRLLLPAGAAGPAFLVTKNFDALLTYNAAVPYALAVTHLADRVSGKNSISALWPRDLPLNLEERRSLQQSLVGLGYTTGGVDGILGRASRSAIRQYQVANGLVADGYPARVLLEHLQQK